MIVLKKPSDPVDGAPDARRYARAKTARTASVWSLDERLLSRANMVDMSAGGACLELATEAALPPHFTVRFERRSGMKAHVVNCQLVWQHEAIAGVRFCEGPLTATS